MKHLDSVAGALILFSIIVGSERREAEQEDLLLETASDKTDQTMLLTSLEHAPPAHPAPTPCPRANAKGPRQKKTIKKCIHFYDDTQKGCPPNKEYEYKADCSECPCTLEDEKTCCRNPSSLAPCDPDFEKACLTGPKSEGRCALESCHGTDAKTCCAEVPDGYVEKVFDEHAALNPENTLIEAIKGWMPLKDKYQDEVLRSEEFQHEVRAHGNIDKIAFQKILNKYAQLYSGEAFVGLGRGRTMHRNHPGR
eukprot:TRINITY_DN48462_c0_g1_i1.p1 TRINITY_DN48462_c0_g1~~TRINITY_DN48462_c0_g1_i1.p1  ORF type:complete len:252 (-),score=32.37 TRINITY_DN48462_c0_g1_i1:91-846(-)